MLYCPYGLYSNLGWMMALIGVTSYNNGQYQWGKPRLAMHNSFLGAIQMKSVHSSVVRTFVGRKEHLESATHWMVSIEGILTVLHIRKGSCLLCTISEGKSPRWVSFNIQTVDNYIQNNCYAYGILTDLDKREIIRVRYDI